MIREDSAMFEQEEPDEDDWVVVCLGNEPLVWGTFVDEEAAWNWLDDKHATKQVGEEDWVCSNGVETESHHVLQLEDLS